MTEQASMLQKRFYQRTLALFVCSLFVGVYIGSSILAWDPLQFVYNTFQDGYGMVKNVVQLYAAFVLYLGAGRMLVNHRNYSRSFVVRAATIIAFSIVLAAFYLTQPEMENSAIASQVNSVLQGSCTYGLFLARYGMMYYWVLRRFCEFRTIDRIAQLAIWFLWVFRDMPILVSFVPGIDTFVDWLRLTLYTGALRGVLITVAVGSFVLSLRALIGREPGLIEAEIS
jgi:hypothetical protein